MSVARQRARSARKTAAKRSALAGNSEVLATSLSARDNTRVGTIEVRKVTVTQRESIARRFVAPRIDMGEYAPVATHDLEMAKGLPDWTAEV